MEEESNKESVDAAAQISQSVIFSTENYSDYQLLAIRVNTPSTEKEAMNKARKSHHLKILP